MMQYKFFTIPVPAREQDEEEINKFLRGHRIISVDKELITTSSGGYWSFLVEYYGTNQNEAGKKGKVDYREVLSNDDFKIYTRLRDVRKRIAEDNGQPVYTICTNEQLAEMAKRRVDSMAALREIPGIGKSKCEQYGELFIKAIKDGKVPVDNPSADKDRTT